MASVTTSSTPQEGFEFQGRTLPVPSNNTSLHRIAAVREQQCLSLRAISRRTGRDVSELRKQELPNADLSLSDLYRWQKALDVPLINLLCDQDDELSDITQIRARMVKVMKTVVALAEVSSSPRVTRLVSMLREQLVDMMPELESIGGWPNYGSRRSSDQMGRIAENPVDLLNLGND